MFYSECDIEERRTYLLACEESAGRFMHGADVSEYDEFYCRTLLSARGWPLPFNLRRFFLSTSLHTLMRAKRLWQWLMSEEPYA